MSAGDAGGPLTWERIVEEQQDRVYRLALHLTRNPHDAADLTHDAFLRIFQNLHTYRPGNFDGWVTRITYNVFRDQWRRRQRLQLDALDEDAAERFVDPTVHHRPEPAWHERHLDYDVRAAVAALPDPFRLAVVLCDIEGMAYQEIADMLGVRTGTVRSRIFRGRRLLRAALADRAPLAAVH